MKIIRRFVFLLLSLTLSTALGLAETKSSNCKLDPALEMLRQQMVGVATAKTMNIIKKGPNQEHRVKTIVRFTGNLNEIEAVGGEIESIIGDIATVDVPLGSLDAVSQMESIAYVEASKKAKPSLDISVPDTGAYKLRGGTPPNWTGATGKDVIVGFVDTGIDLTHPDFRDATGKTRILYLRDQTTGQECTNVMIDNGTCNEIDTEGHGTHVAGIVSGNGSASQFRYVGMAPEADLIVVKTTFYTQDILNGISYIEQKAASLGRPCVINLSLGGDIDPHDGTSNYSKALDNASGPGKIIVGAAGNEARDDIHASGRVSQGFETPVAFYVPPGTPVAIDLWYPGSDLMNIEVITPGCGDTGWVTPGNVKTLSTSCGKISVLSLTNNPNNGDNEIFITLTSNPSPGTWQLSLLGSSITNGNFDAWTDGSASFFSPDSSKTLTDTGCAAKVITVGSYVTRPLDRTEPLAGDVSVFSSHGPRRLCSLCEDVYKPDIAAPGQWIMSAFSKDSSSPYLFLRDPYGGPYIMMQGTSMATPHVSGAVALMLQEYSASTPEDIKSALFSAARTDPYTGSVPNFIWGRGKLDIYNVFSFLPSENISTPTVDGPPNGIAGIAYTFSAGGASSNLGHDVQYLIDWGDGTNSGWLVTGMTSAAHSWNLPGAYVVRAEARSVRDAAVVSGWSSDLAVSIAPPITLQSPSGDTAVDACSLYNIPAFSWTTGEIFKSLQIQFSPDGSFSRVPVRVNVSPKITETIMKSKVWKRVLLIPGPLGGTVYWRVVGTLPDKKVAESDTGSITMGPPKPVENPVISDTSKSSLPTLSWANACNTRIAVWFGNDPDFSRPGIKKKVLTFNIKRPNDNGGVFSRMLTAGQWTAVRRVAENISGSTIYWYLESWDGLKRYTRTDVQSFTLMD